MITPVKTIPIDVIVPIYRGLAETRRCLESVLNNAQRTPFELVAINDASPEPALSEWLEQLAAEGRLTLLTNERNLGFVLTVNRGMSLHPGRDLVLLNSDTEVANDWLDRLVATAQHNPAAGTLTPFSNNATICSYPFEGWNGGVPGTLGLAGLDRLIAETLPGRTIEIPTGVGFCMYIRRTCLDQVGLFDAERFGRGYGEENDFCRRAAAQGWQNLLAADVFVFHEGGVSFAAERIALQEKAMQRLLEAHPDYLDHVHAFIARDPVAPLRTEITRARAACGGAEEVQTLLEAHGNIDADEARSRSTSAAARPLQLHISHSWGGGTERWILDYCRTDTSRRNLLLRSISHRNAAGFRLELVEPAVGYAPLLAWELSLPIRASTVSNPEYARILAQVIDDFHVGSVIVSSLIGHSLEALATQRPTIVLLHDLYPFCPGIFACFGEPCVSCTPSRLTECLQGNPLNLFWHNTVEADWRNLRREYGRLIAKPHIHVVAPSRSVHDQWANLQPGLAGVAWTRIQHGIDRQQLPPLPVGPAHPRLRILIPGRLAHHKGLALFREALPNLLQHATLLLLGCGDFGRPFRDTPGVEVIENYDYSDFASIVHRFSPDCAMLVSIYHESFSYTLSEMFALGLPVLATRVGAFAERIEEGISGCLFDPTPAALLATVASLAAHPGQIESMRAQVASRASRSLAQMVGDYNALLPSTSPDPADQLAAQRIASLRQGADERARARHEVQVQHDTIARQAETIAAQGVWIVTLEERSHHLEHRLHELHASRSWRLSAPLRVLGRTARRVAQPSGHADRPSASSADSAHPARLPQLDEAARREVRERVRHWFGIPDQGQIIVSLGAPPDAAAAGHYLRLIRSLTSSRNPLCAVIAGCTSEAACWRDTWEEMAALLATRRLFFAESLHDREAFILSADAFLAYDEASLRQNGEAAIDAGLFILSPADAATTADYLPVEQSHPVTPDTHDSACAALLAWLDMAPSRRTRIILRSRQVLDDTQQSPAKPTP